MNLVNPAYYTENGFFGTWDGTRGTLDSAPAGFDGLSAYTVDMVSPLSVQNLVVEYMGK